MKLYYFDETLYTDPKANMIVIHSHKRFVRYIPFLWQLDMAFGYANVWVCNAWSYVSGCGCVGAEVQLVLALSLAQDLFTYPFGSKHASGDLLFFVVYLFLFTKIPGYNKVRETVNEAG